MAALLLHTGGPEQLDLAEGWDQALTLLEQGRFQNRVLRVSEILRPGELPRTEYDFAYAFSVFTHLAPAAFWNNLRELARATHPQGTIYLTVRHADFAEFKYPGRLREVTAELATHGFVFIRTRVSGEGLDPVFGDMIVREAHLRERCAEIGSLDYLGMPLGQWQHVYALRVR